MRTETDIAPGDIARAAAVAVICGVGLGTLGSPGIVAAPYVVLVTLPFVIVVTGLAVPVALFCVRRGITAYGWAVLAGIVLGWIGGVLAVWIVDCIEDYTLVSRCSDNPDPARGLLGLSFGLMASIGFWSVLRQRYPAAFGAQGRLRPWQVLLGFAVPWLVAALAGWPAVV